MAEAVLPLLTYDGYLALERSSEVKHEFADGAAVAMAGGTPEHGRLAGALAGAILAAVEGRRCAVFTSDVRIWIARSRRSTYPDLSVVCGRLERAEHDPDAITNPVVIVEVLSDSTEAYDRGEKFRRYRGLPSLREYVLVSTSEPLVEVFRRREDAEAPERLEAWSPSEVHAGETLRLVSLDVAVDIDRLYRDPLADA